VNRGKIAPVSARRRGQFRLLAPGQRQIVLRQFEIGFELQGVLSGLNGVIEAQEAIVGRRDVVPGFRIVRAEPQSFLCRFEGLFVPRVLEVAERARDVTLRRGFEIQFRPSQVVWARSLSLGCRRSDISAAVMASSQSPSPM